MSEILKSNNICSISLETTFRPLLSFVNECGNANQCKQKTERSINVTSECECHKNLFPLWHTNSIYESLSQMFLAELVQIRIQIGGKNNQKFAVKCQKQGWSIHQAISAEM